MIRTRALSVAAVVWLAIAACGGGASTPEPPGDTGEVTPTTGLAAQHTPTPASGGMNLEAVNLCELLPKEEFAELAGGTVIEAAEYTGPTCSYLIDPPGDEAIHTYIAHLESVEIIQALVDYVRDYQVADWITGLGDEAYVQDSSSGPGFDLVVLVRGKFGLSFNGPDPEVMKQAAALLLERIQP